MKKLSFYIYYKINFTKARNVRLFFFSHSKNIHCIRIYIGTYIYKEK